jgi:RNA polymerase sigma-70 factor (ECF subfamily)
MEDKILVERLMAKDPKALEFLYSEYRERVHAVVRRFIRDDSDAEEVVQDTFWTVYRKIHLFRQDSALWSWMYRIAVNAAKMRLRKYKRIPTPVEDSALHAFQHDESIHDLNTRPDERLAVKRMVAEVNAFLDECDDINRKLYVSMELDGMSKEEVADMLDLTVPAVKTRLHRLRVGLRERITPLHAGLAS